MGMKKLLKKLKLPMPKVSEKYNKALKIGMALVPGNLAAKVDPDVLGARGSAKMLGRSVDQAEDKKAGIANEARVAAEQAAADAAAAAEAPFTATKDAYLKGRNRKGRRASILTSSQGVSDPLGIVG